MTIVVIAQGKPKRAFRWGLKRHANGPYFSIFCVICHLVYDPFNEAWTKAGNHDAVAAHTENELLQLMRQHYAGSPRCEEGLGSNEEDFVVCYSRSYRVIKKEITRK